MKKLITGGFGLIGSEFKDCIKISSKDFNLVDSLEVNKMFEIHNPDIVIHTAAKVGGVGANIKSKGDFFYQNIMMNTNVIENAKKFRVKKLISFLSTCIFPDKIDYPLTEEKIHLGPPHFSNDAYAYAKRMAEIQIKSYNEQFNTKFFNVIPTNVYGPKDNYNLENGHVLPSIIHKCYNAIVNDTDLVLWGNGKPLREFIYSKDVAEICDLLLSSYEETEPIIISTSEEVSISEITNMIVKIMGFKKRVVWDESKPNGQHRKPSDNTKLKRILPNYKFTPINEGLEKTIDYFINNYKKVRK